MKLKSLFLGSAAALALTSGALAADPRSSFVSLDVCDAYGITGLTIASADTCLKISGSVSYEFNWGNYRGHAAGDTPWALPAAGARNVDRASVNSVYPGAPATWGALTGTLTGENDWRSRLETILSFEATTQTDAGAAKAHITLRERNYFDTTNNIPQGITGIGATGYAGAHTGTDAHPLRIQDAWVSFGDTTVLMAGKKSSIAKLGDDEPFNFLGLANSQSVEHGVLWNYDDAGPNYLRTGGHVIQVVSEVADGISVGVGLESLDGIAGIDYGPAGVARVEGNSAGSLVGFVEAKGGWGQAHATIVVGNILTDVPNAIRPWGLHTGGTFNFDNFKVRAALAADNTGYWNGLLSGEAAFDLFTLAASAEFINTGNNPVNVNGRPATHPLGAGYGPQLPANVSQLGLGVSAGFQATETIKINAGFRYFDADTTSVLAVNSSSWQAALQLVASLTDTIEATGEVGVYGGDLIRLNPTFAGDTVGYANLGVAYKPGGNFETGAGLEVNSLGAYKLKFNAKKTF